MLSHTTPRARSSKDLGVILSEPLGIILAIPETLSDFEIITYRPQAAAERIDAARTPAAPWFALRKPAYLESTFAESQAPCWMSAKNSCRVAVGNTDRSQPVPVSSDHSLLRICPVRRYHVSACRLADWLGVGVHERVRCARYVGFITMMAMVLTTNWP